MINLEMIKHNSNGQAARQVQQSTNSTGLNLR
jgi:hypothetical protein